MRTLKTSATLNVSNCAAFSKTLLKSHVLHHEPLNYWKSCKGVREGYKVSKKQDDEADHSQEKLNSCATVSFLLAEIKGERGKCMVIWDHWIHQCEACGATPHPTHTLPPPPVPLYSFDWLVLWQKKDLLGGRLLLLAFVCRSVFQGGCGGGRVFCWGGGCSKQDSTQNEGWIFGF